MQVEQEDREAALEIEKVRYKGGHAALHILAAHRTAAEQRGYDRAIAEVVAWLRKAKGELALFGVTLAAAIETGEHKP